MAVKVNRDDKWRDVSAIVLAFIGALVAVGGSILVLANQVQMTGIAIWPLPGFVLLDWGLLGVLGFLAAFYGRRVELTYWLKAAWFVPGAMIPLVVFGAFSIGLFVFISLPFFLFSAILITLQKTTKWLDHLKQFLFGVVCNLGVLLLLIALGVQPFH